MTPEQQPKFSKEDEDDNDPNANEISRRSFVRGIVAGAPLGGLAMELSHQGYNFIEKIKNNKEKQKQFELKKYEIISHVAIQIEKSLKIAIEDSIPALDRLVDSGMGSGARETIFCPDGREYVVTWEKEEFFVQLINQAKLV